MNTETNNKLAKKMRETWLQGTGNPYGYPQTEELFGVTPEGQEVKGWKKLASRMPEYATEYAVDLLPDGKWKTIAGAIGGAVVGALTAFGFTGCGHSVELSPGAATIQKDGSVLSLSEGRLTWSQEPPSPVIEKQAVENKK